MNLLTGIKIFNGNSININTSRIQKSNGTEIAKSSRYLKKAYIPSGGWNKITTYDTTLLEYNDSILLDTGSFISLIKVPKDVTSSFKKIRNEVKKGVSKKELDRIISEFKNNRNNLSIFQQYINSLGKNNNKILIGTNNSGLQTVTYDPSDKQKRYIGLHVDNWYQKSLEERFLSPRRICINLGITSRYLLFINLPLKKISNLLGSRKSLDPIKLIPSTSLGHLFMKEFPDYPVLRIEIPPNEAYIASTENIIHDGSTLNHKNVDVCLHAHGLFYP